MFEVTVAQSGTYFQIEPILTCFKQGEKQFID